MSEQNNTPVGVTSKHKSVFVSVRKYRDMQRKLAVATEALQQYADAGNWDLLSDNPSNKTIFRMGSEPAVTALAEIFRKTASECR